MKNFKLSQLLSLMVLFFVAISGNINAQCSVAIDEVTFTCGDDGAYTAEVCLTHTDPVVRPNVDISILDGTTVLASTTNEATTGGSDCFTLTGLTTDNNYTGLTVEAHETGEDPCVGGGSGAVVPVAGDDVFISFANDGAGSGGGIDECLGEEITIYNYYTDGAGACAAIDISGFQLDDEESIFHVYPAGTIIPAGGSLTINTNMISTNPTGCSGDIGAGNGSGSVLANGGETVFLYDAGGATIDMATGDTPSGGPHISSAALTAFGSAPVCAPPASCCTSIELEEPFCCIPATLTAVAVCNDGTDDAALGMYFVEVEVTDLGSATMVDVSVGGIADSQGASTAGVGLGTYVFGPFVHSAGAAGANGVQIVSVADMDDADCETVLEVVETYCGFDPTGDDDGNVDALEDEPLHSSGFICDCETDPTSTVQILVQAAPGTFAAGGTSMFVQAYVLVDNATGTIMASNNSGYFGAPSISLFDGVYDIYAINVTAADWATLSPLLADDLMIEDALDAAITLCASGDCVTTLDIFCGCCNPDAAVQTLGPIKMCADAATDSALDANGATATVEVCIDFEDLILQPEADYYSYAFLITDNTGVILNVAAAANFVTTAPADFCEDVVLENAAGDALEIGSYCIHGMNYLDAGLAVNTGAPLATSFSTIEGMVGMDIAMLADDLFENDNALTTAGTAGTYTVCGDINIDGCTPVIIDPTPMFTAHPTEVFACSDELVEFCATADVTPFPGELGGTQMVFNLQVLSGSTWVDVAGATDTRDALTASEDVCFEVNTDDFASCSEFRISATAVHTHDDPNDPDETIECQCTGYSDAAMLFTFESITMACNSSLNLSVSPDCTVDLSVTSFFEGDISGCPSVDEETYMNAFFHVVFEGPDGSEVAMADLDEFVGECIVFKVVSNCDARATCWGNVCLEDKLPPALECACPPGGDPILGYSEDCTLKCYQLDHIANGIEDVLTCDYLHVPVGTDNCQTPAEIRSNLVYTDLVIELAGCQESLLRRTWSLVDQRLNELTGLYEDVVVASCTNEYFVEGYSDTDVVELYEADDIENITQDQMENNFFMPVQVVLMTCGDDISPAGIAALFDEEGLPAPSGDVVNTSDVIENHEGYAYAYPFYFAQGNNCAYHPQKIDNGLCNLLTGYSDTPLGTCGPGCYGNNKIQRDWTILDWCSNEVIRWHQVIKAVDSEGPTFDIPLSYNASVDPWDCLADFDLPIPTNLHDDCDGDVTYEVSSLAPVTITGDHINGYSVSGMGKTMPNEPVYFYYTAYDCCGNPSELEVLEVHGVDLTPPVPVTLENLVVNIAGIGFDTMGFAKVYANSLDNGSYDLCSGVAYEIRRVEDNCAIPGNTTFNDNGDPDDEKDDPDGGAYVQFCCDDLSDDADGNRSGEFDVILRVWDDANMDGIFGNSGDNYNETWAHIKLEDKAASVPVCPPNLIVDCEFDFNDLDLTGVPSITSACAEVEEEWIHDVNVTTQGWIKRINDASELNPAVGTEVPAYDPVCRRGALRRQFRRTGQSAVLCTQWIIVEGSNDFDPLTISFPENKTVNCLDDELDEPTWEPTQCELIGYSVESDTFYVEEGVCANILNTYTVINWCTESEYTHTTKVILQDDVSPEGQMVSEACFGVNGSCESDDITITAMATDEGTCASPWIKWTFELDFWGDGTVDLVYSSALHPNDPYYVAPSASGDEVSIVLAPGLEASKNLHKLRIVISDGCSNDTYLYETIEITDKKKPTPYCLNLSTALMENGEVELWAKDFDAGSFDGCSDSEDLLYTFTDIPPPPRNDSVYIARNVALPPIGNSQTGWYTGAMWFYNTLTGSYENDHGQDIDRWVPAERTSGRIFDSEALDTADFEGIITCPMYVWDECGNYDFCIVNLRLVDNDGGGSLSDIAGRIQTEEGRNISDVEVQLMSGIPNYPATQMTDQAGTYAFGDNPMYADYEITGHKNDDYLNGVSTLDIVMIQRHILGIQNLDSGYKMVAGDVNNDENVSAIDLIELRKLILGIYAALPQNDSWRFIDQDWNINHSDPWPIDEMREINQLDQNKMAENYIGVKVGDVNGSVVLNLNNEQSIEDRSNEKLVFTVNDINYKAGEEVRIAFTAENFENINGYQMTMQAKGLEMIDVESGALEMTSANFGLVHQMVTTSWHSNEMITVDENEVLFTLVFNATENNSVFNVLSINSRITQAEAYVGNELKVAEVELRTENTEAEYLLLQNEPNPFEDKTTIAFILPHSAKAKLSIYDVAGKVLHTISGDYSEGINHIEISKDDIGVGGLVYYQLESGDFVDSKKMIIIQ